ncbi:MAG: hypothetical protein IJK98_03300 [Clostridia bacterium]|nr:hypothetical protein [Clostridia bacterium]
MTVNELTAKYTLNPVVLPDGDREISGGYCGDLLSWVMGRAGQDNVWITIMSNMNIVAVASLSDVSAVILAEGVTLEQNVTEVAAAKGVNILSSEKGAFEIAAMIAQDI